MATKKEKEIIMKTRKPGLPVNIPKPTIKSPNAMGKSGTFLSNVNVRPTRAQTAMHDVKTLHKEFIKDVKETVKSKKSNIVQKGAAIASVPMAGTMHAVNHFGVYGLPLFNVVSGQARYNKNKRAGLERSFGVPNVAENRERSKGLSKSDSTLATQGKLPAASAAGRDTPLPSSDGILKNAVSKVLDFVKR